MTGLSIAVNSDNHEVVSLLQHIAKITRDKGALIHPSATIVEEDGDIRVESDADTSPSVLFDIPQEVLSDVSMGDWEWRGAELVFTASRDAPAMTVDLLSAHCALYNATGKGYWFQNQHPRAIFAEDPALTELIVTLRPGFQADDSANSFIKTRVLRLGEVNSTAESNPIVLMPLIDNLNHHPEGAPFSVKGGVRVAIARPTGTRECFASYGSRRGDPLDMALNYGYVDTAVSEARSAPLKVQVNGLGDVRVAAKPTKRKSLLDPPKVTRDEMGLHLSHMTFHRNSPQRLLTPIQMAVSALGVSSDPSRMSQDLVTAIATANLTRIQSLASALNERPSPGLDLLQAALKEQATIIRSGSGVL